MTDEQRAVNSTSHMGHIVTPETRAKLSAASSNQSPETRAKIAAAGMGNTKCLGRIISDETRAKTSATLMGHIMSLEWRGKLSVAQMGNMNGHGGWRGGPQVSQRKKSAKRRLLGFNPLNSWFSGCDAHHINDHDVIYIPEELHSSIRHNQYTGKGMAAMNALAGAFLTEDWT